VAISWPLWVVKTRCKNVTGLFIGMQFGLLGFGPFITWALFFFLQKEKETLFCIFLKLNITTSPC